MPRPASIILQIASKLFTCTRILASGEGMVMKDLAKGHLIRVLPDWQLDIDVAIYLVRPSAQFGSATSAAFRAFIEERFSGGPPWAR